VRGLIAGIDTSGCGCNIGGKFYNVLAYADDMCKLAPSWFGLQRLIDVGYLLGKLTAEGIVN